MRMTRVKWVRINQEVRLTKRFVKDFCISAFISNLLFLLCFRTFMISWDKSRPIINILDYGGTFASSITWGKDPIKRRSCWTIFRFLSGKFCPLDNLLTLTRCRGRACHSIFILDCVFCKGKYASFCNGMRIADKNGL